MGNAFREKLLSVSPLTLVSLLHRNRRAALVVYISLAWFIILNLGLIHSVRSMAAIQAGISQEREIGIQGQRIMDMERRVQNIESVNAGTRLTVMEQQVQYMSNVVSWIAMGVGTLLLQFIAGAFKWAMALIRMQKTVS